MDDIREHYLAWLRDAHAMEEQALTMMRGMLSRLENYPVLCARMEQHVAETERQVNPSKSCSKGATAALRW